MLNLSSVRRPFRGTIDMVREVNKSTSQLRSLRSAMNFSTWPNFAGSLRLYTPRIRLRMSAVFSSKRTSLTSHTSPSTSAASARSRSIRAASGESCPFSGVSNFGGALSTVCVGTGRMSAPGFMSALLGASQSPNA